MTKKIVAMMMAGAVVFSLTACASTTKADSSESSATEAAASTEADTETEAAEAASLEESEETEEASTEETAAEKAEAVPLTEDEQELLEIMAEDIVIVTDEDYAQTVEELAYHTGEFNGKVYQIEGVYTVDGDLARVSRTLVNGEEETECGLPLVYMEKEIEPNSWIRVTGIVNEGEVDEETVNVLEVIAVESLEEAGNAVLEWDGSAHQH